MTNKKIGEGFTNPNVKKTPVPTVTPKKATSTNAMQPAIDILNKAKTDALNTPPTPDGRRPAKGVIPDIDADSAKSTLDFIEGHELALGIVTAFVAFRLGRGALSAMMPGKPGLKPWIGKRGWNAITNSKWAQKYSAWSKVRAAENLQLAIAKAEDTGQISRKLAWQLRRSPERQVTYLKQIGAIDGKISEELKYLMTHGSVKFKSEWEIINAKAAVNLYKKAKGDGQKEWANVVAQTSSYLGADDLAKLKAGADALRNINKKGGRTFPTIPKVNAITDEELRVWRNTTTGQKLSPLTKGKATMGDMPQIAFDYDLKVFKPAIQKNKAALAKILNTTEDEISREIRLGNWVDLFNKYDAAVKTAKLPYSYANITQWPSFKDWQMSLRTHNWHKNLWANRSGDLQKQYEKDRAMWMLGKSK